MKVFNFKTFIKKWYNEYVLVTITTINIFRNKKIQGTVNIHKIIKKYMHDIEILQSSHLQSIWRTYQI